MKTFARHKSVDEILGQCSAGGIPIDISKYVKDGHDHIVVGAEPAVVFYNTFNGRFFGTTPEGVSFSSDSELDGTPWFDALLNFFYE